MTVINRMEESDRYCQAIRRGDHLYIGGQMAYKSVGQDIKVQAREVLGRVDRFLQDAGMTRSDLMMVYAFFSDRNDIAGFNEVWDSWVDRDALPTRAALGGAVFREGFKLELTAYAFAG